MIAMKNFEMPENCNKCDLTNECGLCLVDNGSCDYDSRYRPTTCPLVEVGKWIPCSEKLPGEAGYYLVTAISYRTNKPEVFISFFETNVYEDGKWICQWCNNHADKHLAWMPLPDPYKGVDDNG